ncbi:MAG: hypothetical protein IPM69_00275 [Ignavibacteria bacterium]|nr:hypothetical protein [Ignavibacteria bacterium]
MKTVTNTLHISSRSSSFWMNFTFALLVGSMLPLLVASTSAQVPFFREYAPSTTDATNEGRCIIRPLAGNDKFLSIGQFFEPNLPTSGHGIWTNNLGTLNTATNYNAAPFDDLADYALEFIEDSMVTGTYGTYDPTYTGHPAVGYKILDETIGETVYKVAHTWPIILDPTDRQIKWDHIIDNGDDDHSFGVSLVRDQTSTNDFFVLSYLENVVTANMRRFAVTQYTWVLGDDGHQVGWTFEYNLDGYQLYPEGIVQGTDDELVVVGNVVANTGGDTRIFSCQIDHTNGAIANFRIYETFDPWRTENPLVWDGNIIANSVTGPYTDGHFLIAGKAMLNDFDPIDELPGISEIPMIFSINSNLTENQMALYPYKTTSEDELYLNGEFNCAKQVVQTYAGAPAPGVARVTAVGRLGNSSTYPTTTGAFVMNATNLNTLNGIPGWATLQSTDFTTGTSPTASTAKWFVPAPDTVLSSFAAINGTYIYTGHQTGGGTLNAIQGSVKKVDGTSECYTTPYSDGVIYPPVESETEEPDYTEWGDPVEDSTVLDTPELSPLKCNGGTISAGKRGSIDEPITGNAPASGESATITVVGYALNIQYSTTEASSIKLVVVDLLGNMLVNQRVSCSYGTHYYTIDTKDWLIGPYFVSVISAWSLTNKNIVIIR